MKLDLTRGVILAVGLLAGTATAVVAQNYPTRPVTVVSPFTGGNANDIVARIVLDQVATQIGQTFVIENRPGAGGAIGASAVAKATPDGYTTLLHSSSLSSLPIMHSKLPYDAAKDFKGVAMFGTQPTVLVTSPAKPFRTVQELVAAAKAKPGSLFFASAGVGSTSHMAAERFRHAAGFQAQHVPFRGPNEAFSEVLAGRIDFYFLPLAPAMSLVKSGKMRPLMVGAEKRVAALPDVPTTMELGWPQATYEFWGGLSVPTKTPQSVIDKLNQEINKALARPDIKEKLAKISVDVKQMSPADFDKYFQADLAATIKLAHEIGLKPVD